jgi:hypothetical protein
MHYAKHMFMSSGFGQFALWPEEGTPKTGVKDLCRQSYIVYLTVLLRSADGSGYGVHLTFFRKRALARSSLSGIRKFYKPVNSHGEEL